MIPTKPNHRNNPQDHCISAKKPLFPRLPSTSPENNLIVLHIIKPLVGWLFIVASMLIGLVASPIPAKGIHPKQTMPSLQATRAPFGVEIQPGSIRDRTLQQRAEEMGTAWVRFNSLSWRDIQPNPDTPIEDWNWESMATFEADLQNATELGFTPLVIVDDFPDWATIPYINPYTNKETIAPCAALKQEYFDDYALFLRQVVTRYKEPPYNVRYWEMGNEVDVDPRLLSRDLQDLFGCWGNIEDPYYGGEHYGQMLKVVVPEMKSVDSNAQIVIGGFLMDRADTQIVGRGKPEKFFEGILKAGAADTIDFVSFHSYPWYDWEKGREGDSDLSDYRWSMWGGMTIGKAQYLRHVMQQYNIDKPLILSEAALLFWGTTPTEDFLQSQADHAVRVVTRAMSQRIQAHIWYTLHHSGWNSSGLLHSDYKPTPAYTAYQQLAQQVRESNFTPQTVTAYGSTLEAYRFDVRTHLVDIVWAKNATDTAISLSNTAFIQAFSRDGAALQPLRSPTRVVVPIGIAPVYIHHKVLDADSIPSITSVTPSSITNDTVTPITINGTNLSPSSIIALEQIRQKEIISYILQQSTSGDTNTVHANIPAHIPPGTYDLVVSQPNGGLDVRVSTLKIVAAYSPHIDHVFPQHGQTNADNILHIYGTDTTTFLEHALVQIGPLALSPTYTMRISKNHLRVTIPGSMLNSGTYALSVTNPDTVQDTLEDAFVMLNDDDVDLTGYTYELWTDPLVPRTGTPNRVGLVVHYQGNSELKDAAQVSFSRLEYPSTGILPVTNVELGVRTVALSTPPHAASTEALEWTVEMSGTYEICASIDPNNTIAEAIEDNNEICRVLTVLPEASDKIAPEIQSFTINNGQDTTITPTVALQVVANDDASTVTSLLFQEYEYSPGAATWIPTFASTEWITYTEQEAYNWSLLPSTGKKYLQVWASDTFGNIASPVSASIAYQVQQQYGTPNPPGEPHYRTVPPVLLATKAPQNVEYRIYLPLIQQP